MKMVAVFLVFFCLPLLSTVAGASKPRILNGTQTPPGVFQFLPAFFGVYETANGSEAGICSSTIISPRHILIAAHCIITEVEVGDTKKTDAPKFKTFKKIRMRATFFDNRPMEAMIRGPDFKIKSIALKKFIGSTKIFVHPSFSTVNSFSDDIAIFEFPEGTNLGIPPIKLASDYQEKGGDKAIAAGYGVYKVYSDPKTNLQVKETPTEMQNVTVAVHIPEKCPSFQAHHVTVPTVICTGTQDYRADQGDSGGPLFLQRKGEYYQIGITSCLLGDQNAFYTRLSSQCDWISKVTKGAVNCVPLPPADGGSSVPHGTKKTDAPESPSNATTAAPQDDGGGDYEENGTSDSTSFNVAFLLSALVFMY